MKHILEIPWSNAELLKETYGLKPIKGGLFVYSSALLPKELRPYQSTDFSLARWYEDESNAHVSTPSKHEPTFKPYKHQIEAQEKIKEAFDAGKPGFLLADKHCLGKRMSTLVGITSIARNNETKANANTNKQKLLIVSNNTSIPIWKDLLHHYPAASALLRILVIPYSDLNKLLTAPASARLSPKRNVKARITARSGTSTINWDYIIFDDSHVLKNPQTSEAQSAAAVGQLNYPYVKGTSPYVVFSTATPGSSPIDFAIMGKLFSPYIRSSYKNEITPSTWGDFLINAGFSVKKKRYGYSWEPLKPEDADIWKKRDVQRMLRSLRHADAPFLMRTKNDLPDSSKVPTTVIPIELKGFQKITYTQAWDKFRQWINTHPKAPDFDYELSAYKNVTESLKVDYIANYVRDLRLSDSAQIVLWLDSTVNLEKYLTKIRQKKYGAQVITDRTKIDQWKAFVNSDDSFLIVTDTLEYSKLPKLKNNSIFIATNTEQVKTLLKETEGYTNVVIKMPILSKTIEEYFIKDGITLPETESKIRELAARTTPPDRLS